MSRLLSAMVVLATWCAATACASDEPEVGEPVKTTTQAPLGPLGIDVASEDLVELKAGAGMLDCPTSPERDPDEPAIPASVRLPSVTLPCLGGGRDVRLDQLEGPMLINLWASDCAPCRHELPVLEQVHELGRDQLTVFGIDYEDEKPYNALQLAAESGVTYASVADLHGVVATELQVVALPQTVFVDGSGAVVATHRGEIRSYAQAAGLVLEHLGLRLPAAGDDEKS